MIKLALCSGNLGMVTGSAAFGASLPKEESPTPEVVSTMLEEGRGDQAHVQTRVGRVSSSGKNKVRGRDQGLPGSLLKRRLQQATELQGVPQRRGAGGRVQQHGLHEAGESAGRAAGGVDRDVGSLRWMF